MSKKYGRVVTWTDGDRLRVCLEFYVPREKRPRRIYSDVDRWGKRHALTPDSAADLLRDIQAEIRGRDTIEAALAPFLASDAPENLFGARWGRYLEQKRYEVAQKIITRGHLRELEGMARRGYLAGLWDRSIFEMDFAALQDWLRIWATEKPDLSPKTRKHALTAVMGCLNWYKTRRELSEVPAVPEIPIDEHAPVLLSQETQDAILEAIPAPARGVFLAMALMGLRVGEARALPASCYRDGILTVDKAAADNLASGPTKGTKTHKVRRLPVPDRLAAWIEQHVDAKTRLSGATLFINPRGKTATKRWSPSALDRTWNRACLQAIGYRVAPLYEGTRHSFATLALNAGADQYSVQKFLGHTDAKTTERYAKLADGALLDVIRHGQKKPTQSA